MAARPIAEDLFTWPVPDPPRTAALIGSRCDACSAYMFPVASGCAHCGAEAISRVELASRGRLYTWTTQEFLPKAPYIGPETNETFRPWAIGYVELPGELRVESRIFDVDPASLYFDQELELVIRPFTEDPDGSDVWTFGFRPAASEELADA